MKSRLGKSESNNVTTMTFRLPTLSTIIPAGIEKSKVQSPSTNRIKPHSGIVSPITSCAYNIQNGATIDPVNRLNPSNKTKNARFLGVHLIASHELRYASLTIEKTHIRLPSSPPVRSRLSVSFKNFCRANPTKNILTKQTKSRYRIPNSKPNCVITNAPTVGAIIVTKLGKLFSIAKPTALRPGRSESAIIADCAA